MKNLYTRLAAFTVGILLSLPVRAESLSISAATAIPEGTRTSTTKTMTFFDPLRGAGVRFVPGVTGQAVLYLPVVLPDHTMLRSMNFKVDGVSSARVTANLYKQPTGSGRPLLLGTLSIANETCHEPLIASTDIPAHMVDNLENAYFVRIELSKNSGPTPSSNPALYHVGVSDSLGILATAARRLCPPDPPTRP
jgi:hypothetical protein